MHDETVPPIPLADDRETAWTRVASGWQLLTLLVLVAGVNVALCFPGEMMSDSWNQYSEALNGRFSDWHPPVMAWLWSKMMVFGDGPGPMFLLHLAAYWFGIGAIADALRRTRHARLALLVALAGAFPPFVFLNLYVIKDVGMAASYLAAMGIVFWCRVQGRRLPPGALLAVGALLAYGTLVRTNAVFALGPLLVYAIAPGRWLRTFRLGVATLVVTIAAIPASSVVNDAMFQPVKRHAVDSLFFYDIAGIAAQRHEPSLLGARARMDDDLLQRCYSPIWWDPFSAWGPCGGWVSRPSNDLAVDGEGLPRLWVGTIAAHPGDWLVHRLKHFNSELMFAVPLKHMRFAPEYRGTVPGYPALQVFTPEQVRMDLLRKNPVVWPVTWLVWAGVLLVFLARRPSTGAVLAARALTMSAVAYSSAYLVVGVATDLRYHYWAMLATAMATIIVLPELAKGWRRRSGVLVNGLCLLALVVAVGLAARLLDFQGWVA